MKCLTCEVECKEDNHAFCSEECTFKGLKIGKEVTEKAEKKLLENLADPEFIVDSFENLTKVCSEGLSDTEMLLAMAYMEIMSLSAEDKEERQVH